MTGRVRVAGLDFDLLTRAQLLSQLTEAIGRGSGGTIVTPNVDICRRAKRDPASSALVAQATVVVPDGVPVLWAARLAGRPLAERITGADLIFWLSELAAANSWPVFLLGGRPGADGQPGAAELAAARLTGRYPGLRVSGSYSPPVRFDAATSDITDLRRVLATAGPALVFVGLGFPKQEQLIARLSADLPGTWFLACGAAIPFAAGQLHRAPSWLQRAGLEWACRLISEPRRLARRYLVDDLPFAVALLATSAWQRRRTPDGLARPATRPWRRAGSGPAPARDGAEPAAELLVERQEVAAQP